MSSSYCERSDVEAIVGEENVIAWGKLDDDDNAAAITARINHGIDIKSDYVDDCLRSSHYRIPLTAPAGSIPSVIVSITAQLVACWLRTARGIEDFDGRTGKPLHELSPLQAEAEQELMDIRVGKKRIEAL